MPRAKLWSGYGHDLFNTNSEDTGTGAISSPSVKWRKALDASTACQGAAIMDLNGDGYPEIIFGAVQGDSLYALQYDGSILWAYGIPDNCWETCPAVHDIDGDNLNEVIAGCNDGNIYVFENDGTLKWTYLTDGAISNSSPAVADINNDGDFEIVVGGEGKKLYVINADGTLQWSVVVDSFINCAPTIGDIDGDNLDEIIVDIRGDGVRAFEHDGTLKWYFSAPQTCDCPPVLADVNGDGDLEILFGGYEDSTLHVLNPDGTELWGYKTTGELYAALSVGNLDADPEPEIVICPYDPYIVYAIDNDGSSSLWSYEIGHPVEWGSIMVDIDDDGEFEILVQSRVGSPDLYCFNKVGH